MYPGHIKDSSAAVDDVVALCLLILIISLVNASSGLDILWIFLVGVVYVTFIAVVVSRGYRWLLSKEHRLTEAEPSKFIVVNMFIIVLISAWFANALDIHVIFRGFVIGVIMPHVNLFAMKLAEKFEDYITILFLLLYFVYQG